MSAFVQLKRSIETMELMKNPNAFVLYTLITK